MADYLHEVPERYRITFDRLKGAFFILDMWHDSVKNLPPDATLADDSPAMKVINELEVNALIGQLKNMGWLDKFIGPIQNTVNESNFKVKTIQEVSIENITAIVQSNKDESVTKEAISAIRDIISKI
jgi:hypothetical protein